MKKIPDNILDTELLPENNDFFEVQSDQIFNHERLRVFDRKSLQNLNQRDEQYKEILSEYYKYIRFILHKNPFRQSVFFYISIGLLIFAPVQFIICLVFVSKDTSLFVLVASSIEIISTLLIIPKVVADYLFNTNETTSINDVVAAIQDYDIAILKGIRHTTENESPQKE